MGRQFPEQYSSSLKKVLRGISMGQPNVVGSSDDHKVMYSGDYDLIETQNWTKDSVRGFQALVKRCGRLGTITDIKVGEVLEWQLLRDDKYDQALELHSLGQLWQSGIITETELKEAKHILKPHLTIRELADAKKELRYGVLRWTPSEVAVGVLKYRGRVFRLEDSMKSPGITKVDLVTWVDTKYVEVSNIILWASKGEFYADVPSVEKGLSEDILRYEEDGNWMKVVKRMYSIAKYKGLIQDQKDLLSILNSHLGAIYTVVSDLELLEEFKEATTAPKRKKELDLMRDRMAKLYFHEFDGATNPRQLLPDLKEVLNKETKKAMDEKKLYPLSPDYRLRRKLGT